MSSKKMIPLTEPSHPQQIHAIYKLMDKLNVADMIYCDVGCCIGELLQYYSQMMSFGYAFEPNSGNYEYLKKEYSDKNVVLENIAVSSDCGSVDFLSTEKLGDHCSRNIKYSNENTSSSDYFAVPTPCISLDEYFKNKEVDFIKIDVEGGEWDVLRGAKELMKNKNVIFQVEFHEPDDWYQRQFIYDNGYEIYSLDLEKYERDCNRPYQAFLMKEEGVLNGTT